MNTLDAILLIFILLAAISGLMRGFVVQLTGLLGWLVGFLLVFILWSSPLLLDTMSTPVALILSFVLLLGGRFLASCCSGLLHPLTRLPVLKQVDCVLGLTFAMVRASIIVMIMVFMLYLLPWGVGHQWIEESQIATGLLRFLGKAVYRPA